MELCGLLGGQMTSLLENIEQLKTLQFKTLNI